MSWSDYRIFDDDDWVSTEPKHNWDVGVYYNSRTIEPEAVWIIHNKTRSEAEKEVREYVDKHYGGDADWNIRQLGE